MKDQINENEAAEIARLIGAGFTSGILDDEDGKRIFWELKTEVIPR